MKRALPSAFLYRKVSGLELGRVACLLTLLSPLSIRGGGDNLKHSSLYALFETIHAERNRFRYVLHLYAPFDYPLFCGWPSDNATNS